MPLDGCGPRNGILPLRRNLYICSQALVLLSGGGGGGKGRHRHNPCILLRLCARGYCPLWRLTVCSLGCICHASGHAGCLQRRTLHGPGAGACARYVTIPLACSLQLPSRPVLLPPIPFSVRRQDTPLLRSFPVAPPPANTPRALSHILLGHLRSAAFAGA